MAPNVIDTMTASMVTAITVAEPRSDPLAGLTHRHRFPGDAPAQPHRRSHAHPRHHEPAVIVQLHPRAAGRDALGCRARPGCVTASGEPGRLPCGIDATQLGGHRRNPGQTRHEHDGERRDRERRLDGGPTRVPAQTLVFSALAMMFVNVLTIESPVTTV